MHSAEPEKKQKTASAEGGQVPAVHETAEKLKELEQLIGYFAAKGEGEIWRVNKLAYFFHATLTSLREYELSPYPEPVLQAKLRTPARMKALQMFTNAFPALKELLYR
jgi:hypothetical protein